MRACVRAGVLAAPVCQCVYLWVESSFEGHISWGQATRVQISALLWVTDLASLHLSFLFCKMGTMRALTSSGLLGDAAVNSCIVLRAVAGSASQVFAHR